ncbi:MAG: DUF3341 domain-containing protein [Vicinamibacterales bacterium]|jgi:hypothetical protein|nr:DUF3341 domain-containing protein [Vicinamibacterales bacterium]
MSRRVIVGTFVDEDDVLDATRESRAAGLEIVDVLTPYHVHGLETAAGLSPSKLPFVCLGLGLTGAALALWFQFWSTAVDWPLNVGGRPWNSWPAFVPVIFEMMVLFGGLGTVAVFLATNRLRPGRRAPFARPEASDDRFVLIVAESGEHDARSVRRLFARFHVADVDQRELDPEEMPG